MDWLRKLAERVKKVKISWPHWIVHPKSGTDAGFERIQTGRSSGEIASEAWQKLNEVRPRANTKQPRRKSKKKKR